MKRILMFLLFLVITFSLYSCEYFFTREEVNKAIEEAYFRGWDDGYNEAIKMEK